MVLVTSMPVTKAGIEDVIVLDWVFCICYLIWFKKSKVQVQALINSGSKINAIFLGYTLKLGLKVCPTNIRIQNINDSTFKTFRMVLASF